MLGDVNKLCVFKSLLTTPSNVLPYYLKQTFPPIIWIFTQGEEDEIESKLSSSIFSTLGICGVFHGKVNWDKLNQFWNKFWWTLKWFMAFSMFHSLENLVETLFFVSAMNKQMSNKLFECWNLNLEVVKFYSWFSILKGLFSIFF